MWKSCFKSWCCISIVGVLFALGGPRSDAADVPAEQAESLEERIRRIMRHQHALKLLFFDNYATTVSEETTRVDRILSAFAPQRTFIEFIHRVGPSTPPWVDEGRFRMWLDDDGGTVFKPFERVAAPAADELSQLFRNDFYNQAIGWHPNARYFTEHNTGLYVEQILATNDISNLQMKSEYVAVNDIPCIEITTKSQSDQFWFAPHLNYCLVKRSISRGEQQKNGLVLVSSEFREVAADLWLPYTVHVKGFDDSDGAGNPTHITFESEIRVSQLAVNEQVPDEVFAIDLPPGTITTGPDGAPVEFQPRGADLLEFWGTWCSVVAPASTPPRPLFWLIVVMVCNACSAALLGFILLSQVDRFVERPLVTVAKSK